LKGWSGTLIEVVWCVESVVAQKLEDSPVPLIVAAVMIIASQAAGATIFDGSLAAVGSVIALSAITLSILCKPVDCCVFMV
jgi:hypothetical protein